MSEATTESLQESDRPAPATKPQDAADRLGTEPVGRLLLRFSIPAITGMLVNALYNVVDRVFIGRAVSEIALGGIALVMPLMVITMGFAMLFGFGAANMISMRLGQGRRKEAENAFAHCLILLFGVGVLFTVVGIAFTDQILSVLGAPAQSESLVYARGYFRIILYSTVFGLVGFGLSHCTRAQGFPLITMVALLMGAVLNIGFDALFIVAFGWGVEGAGWATVVAQGISMAWILRFCMGKGAVVRFSLKTFKPSFAVVRQIMSFGSAHFMIQIMGSFVILLFNTNMGRHGAAALGVGNGGDIALSGWNIVGALQMLVMMPIFGINQGAQPLLGYNYGAKKFDRVLRAFRLGVAAGTVVCLIGFAGTMLFPSRLVGLFVGDGDPLLVEFAAGSMRIIFIMMPAYALIVMGTTFFVVTGRPKVSVMLSLLRQGLILIPILLVFGRIWGLWGVIAAVPVSDTLALFITGTMIFFELRKMKRMTKEAAE